MKFIRISDQVYINLDQVIRVKVKGDDGWLIMAVNGETYTVDDEYKGAIRQFFQA